MGVQGGKNGENRRLIWKTKDRQAQARQLRVPLGIQGFALALAVLQAVQFDDKLVFSAVKIHDIGANGMLPPELDPFVPAGTQSLPKLCLPWSLAPPQSLGALSDHHQPVPMSRLPDPHDTPRCHPLPTNR
jgi:hypothetical protein